MAAASKALAMADPSHVLSGEGAMTRLTPPTTDRKHPIQSIFRFLQHLAEVAEASLRRSGFAVPRDVLDSTDEGMLCFPSSGSWNRHLAWANVTIRVVPRINLKRYAVLPLICPVSVGSDGDEMNSGQPRRNNPVRTFLSE